MERREFIKAAAATAAAAAASPLPNAAASNDPPAIDGVTWDKSPRRFCGTGCRVPISWDEALDVIADRILAAPDQFAMYVQGAP